ncbi:MAG: metalloregulator ArsR/SmtB family transcription factor [Spirochaetota bacterium]
MRINSVNQSNCSPEEHQVDTQEVAKYNALSYERAAGLFRALGDESRLKLLQYIAHKEACVTEIAQYSGEGLSTVSQRLKLLRFEGLVKRRREGKHLYYSLTDSHIYNLMQNALEHVTEK